MKTLNNHFTIQPFRTLFVVLLGLLLNGLLKGQAMNSDNDTALSDNATLLIAESSEYAITSTPTRETWDLVASFNGTSGYQYGVITDGQYIYTSSWNSSSSSMFYKYDLQGNFIEEFNISDCGLLRGVTYDGQYFYGVANSNTIYCVDLVNHALVSTVTSAYGNMRCITYDPQRDGFWVVGNWSGNLTLINRSGAIVQAGPTPTSASDVAYYKDADNIEHIFLFCQTSSEGGAVVYDYNITTNTLGSNAVCDVISAIGGTAGSSGGCCVGTYNDKTCFFADVQQSPQCIAIFELGAADGFYNFDDGTLQGWTNIDADGDGYGWVTGAAIGGVYLVSGATLAGSGHNSSEGLACSGSYTNVSQVALTPNNYLVSPTKATYNNISFWACAQDATYAAEHFGVAVSTTTATATAFTTIQEWTMTAKELGAASPGRDGNRAQGNWYHYSVDLSAYAGQEIWVAIRHFNCSDKFILNIDDITLGEGSPSASYSITATASPSNGGTVTGAGTYVQGASCTLTATPATGYSFSKWTKNGNQVSTNASYTFTVTESASYVAVFTQSSCSVNASANPAAGGTVSGAGTYNYGASCTLTATPNTGYTFTKWTKNGTQVSINPSYTFTVNGSATYIAVFTLVNYSVTVSSDPVNGGVVNGGGNYTYGQSCTLTAAPNAGYVFDKWTKNGTTVSTNPVFTISVTGNANYVAHFLQSTNSYTIMVIADPLDGGTVSGGGTYEQGSSCVLTAVPNEGYVFENWTKNGTIVSTNPVFTINVVENLNLVAHFSALTNNYSITINANPLVGGIVNGGGNYSPGSTCTVTAVANDGYSFANWTENGAVVSLDEQYSFVVERNRFLYANFNTASCYYISASAGANGSITPQGDIEITAGGEQTFSITPNFGCRISRVLVDGVDLGPLETYTFSNVNSNHTISAVFSGWGVEESQTVGVMLYPNPTKDCITVKGQDIAGIQIFNLQGEKVLDLKCINEEGNVNLGNLSSGTYLVLITLQNGKQCYSKIVLSN